MPDFLAFASASAEQLWKSVEDQLHNAIKAARAGHLHDQNAHTQAITDCIALHLVRSIRYLELHRSIIADSTESVRRRAMLSKAGMLQSEFRRRYGLEAAGPEALAIILDDPISKWQLLEKRGALVRTSMEAMFHRARDTLRAQAVEVWHVPRGYELLISDSPAVTFRYLAENASIEPNVAIGDSDSIVLPLARDCMVAIRPEAKDSELLPDQVFFFNRLQVEISHRYVYYYPGGELNELVQETLLRRRRGEP